MTWTKQWITMVGLVAVTALAVIGLQAAVVAHPGENPVPLAQSSRVFIAPSSTSVSQGDVFTVGVMVENARDMIGYEFRLLWDSPVLTVTGVVDAGFLLGDPLQSMYMMSARELAFEAFLLPPYEDGADGDGLLAVVTLQALGPGISRLDLHHVAWYDADSPAEPRRPVLEGGRVFVDTSFVHLPLVLRAFGP